MNKILIDTNVFVYGIDQDSIYFKRARQILDGSEPRLVTTSKNLMEFLAVVTRSTGYELHTDLVLEILDEIIRGVEIIYPTHESVAIILELMSRYQPKGLKVHDIEIVSIELANGVSEVATFNTKDFQSLKEVTLSNV